MQVPATTELPMDGVENKDLDVLNTVANDFSSSVKWNPIKDCIKATFKLRLSRRRGAGCAWHGAKRVLYIR